MLEGRLWVWVIYEVPNLWVGGLTGRPLGLGQGGDRGRRRGLETAEPGVMGGWGVGASRDGSGAVLDPSRPGLWCCKSADQSLPMQEPKLSAWLDG